MPPCPRTRKATTINTDLKPVALAARGAMSATGTQVSVRTRAQVQAELKTAAPPARGDVYPVPEQSKSIRTREDVRAEAAARSKQPAPSVTPGNAANGNADPPHITHSQRKELS